MIHTNRRNSVLVLLVAALALGALGLGGARSDSCRTGSLCDHGNDAQLAAGQKTSARTPSSSTRIGCYGDGITGPRVQAVYVYELGKPNRIGYLTPYFQRWAAGIDTQFDHSAMQSGGHRHVRYVTTTTGSSCTLQILSLGMAASDLASMSKSTSALAQNGLNKAGTKYLIWTESSVLCGVGTTYLDAKPGQDNLNNGYAAQYARIDHPCWGYAEAHELMHTMGGVQPSAPHATAGQHCRDGADQMCYSDGTRGSTPQLNACGSSQGLWFDCGHDDYFNAAPQRSGYLATHWDVADSAFLAATWSSPLVTQTAPDPSGAEADGEPVEAGAGS